MSHQKTMLRRLVRSAVVILSTVLLILILFVAGAWLYMIRMPGNSFHADLPPLTQREVQVRDQFGRQIHQGQDAENEVGQP